MAQVEGSFSRIDVQMGARAEAFSGLARLRLVTGSLLLLISLVGLLGGDWDIQSHALVGRDRTFTPPHDLILISIGLTGLVALASILIETNVVRRQPGTRVWTSDFLGILHSSLGAYLIGFGAVCSAVAFPLDTYWHALYGIDVSLWAPFHTMIYLGGVLSTFGVIYMLVSAAHLAELHQDGWTARLSYAAVVAALGLLLSRFSTFLTPAISGHSLHLASLTLNLFPCLLALCAVFVCVLARRLVPWIGAASLVIVVFFLLFLLVSAFVPPMITMLVQAEHETYLARASRIGSIIVPLLGQTPLLLLLALSIDGMAWVGRRRQWKLAKSASRELLAALVSMFVVAGLTLLLIGGARAVPGGGGRGALAFGFLFALLLTIPGSLLGNWLAATISESIQGLRR